MSHCWERPLIETLLQQVTASQGEHQNYKSKKQRVNTRAKDKTSQELKKNSPTQVTWIVKLQCLSCPSCPSCWRLYISKLEVVWSNITSILLVWGGGRLSDQMHAHCPVDHSEKQNVNYSLSQSVSPSVPKVGIARARAAKTWIIQKLHVPPYIQRENIEALQPKTNPNKRT